MLALGMREGEKVVIQLPGSETIDVMIVRATNGKVRIGFEAPKNVTILREKLLVDGKKGVEA